jgi:hypothetical protein
LFVSKLTSGDIEQWRVDFRVKFVTPRGTVGTRDVHIRFLIDEFEFREYC